MSKRKRVALIGASTRVTYAFAQPILTRYADTHEIVGCFDINPERIRVVNEYLKSDIPAFSDLDEMMKKTTPDFTIITTMDSTHVDYIVRGLKYGVGFMCDKPLCTDSSQCRAIMDALRENPNMTAVAGHNYRYSPSMLKMRELIDAGKIGQIRSVVFCELLDREHGTSYFRRWNGRMKNSGGLLIHKASHHFDLINWFVQSRPATVSATGGQVVFGPHNSSFRGKRCATCEHTDKCPYYMKIEESTGLRTRLAFAASRNSKAFTTDLCVYGEDADSVDHATVGIVYENGVQATYDLVAFASLEGVDIRVEGSDGTLEHHQRQGMELDTHGRDGSATIVQNDIRFISPEGRAEDIPVPVVQGGHGGADPVMLEELLGLRDPSAARATLQEAVQAVLIGDAANRSIEQRRHIDVQPLLEG